MKTRSPKFAFLLVLVASVCIFTYLNFCPSVGNEVIDANSMLTEAKQRLSFPELEVMVKLVKAVTEFLIP
ncbi:MAG: hypothetical protein ABI844_04270 [Saprospiraceae bacterium]